MRQSIGIKEFLPFLELSEDNRPTSKGQRILKQCYEDLKLHTRKYSRTQRKWFKQRFMRRAKLREVSHLIHYYIHSCFRFPQHLHSILLVHSLILLFLMLWIESTNFYLLVRSILSKVRVSSQMTISKSKIR